MFKKIELQEGVTLYIRKSEQFKTVNFSVKWKTALDEKNRLHRAVLANVLEDSNGRYRTQTNSAINWMNYMEQYCTRMLQNVVKRILFLYMLNV